MQLWKNVWVATTFLLVTGATLCAESDISGWGKATWGMTHAQVSKIYKLDPWQPDNPPKCKLKDRIKIFGKNFAVAFFFDERSPKGKLFKVVLVHFDVDSDDTAWLLNIKEMLVDKYGVPTFFDIVENMRTSRWLKSEGHLKLSTVTDRKVMCAIEYTALRIEGEKL